MSVTPSTARRNVDYRLLLPAVTAWAVTSAVIGLEPNRHPPLFMAALVVAVSSCALLATKGPRRSIHRLTAAVLLTAAAAATTTALHTADLHRGPLPALARPPAPLTPPPPPTAPPPFTVPAPSTGPGQSDSEDERAAAGRPVGERPVNPEVTVQLTVTGDPKQRGPHPGGSPLSRPTLTVPALVTRVRLDPVPHSGSASDLTTRTRTPVTLLIRSQEDYPWRQLIPSTELELRAEVLPERPTASGGRSRTDSAALLVPQGPPRVTAPPSLPQRLAAHLREGLRDACDHLPPDSRGLLPGLVVGDVSRLPDDLADAFRATDLGHLVAVSGANLAIILAVLVGGTSSEPEAPVRGGLAGVLGLSFRTTALLGTVLTLAFVTVCRPDPSVLRAAATGLIGLLALATGRPRSGVPALAGAVLILILVDPQLARSYGFLLSALATAGLLVLGPRWTAALRARGWPRHLASAVGATAAAQAFCSPVTVLLAPRVSLVGVPCNLLAEIAVAPATLLGFGALAAAPLSKGTAEFLTDLAALPVGWLATVARHGAELPGAELAWPAGPFGAVLLVVVILSLAWAVPPLLAGHRSRSRRTRGLVALAVALLLPVVLLRPPSVVRLATGWPARGWRLAVCDIGQGDMTVLPVGPGSAVVVDAGPDPKAADDCLRGLGVTEIPLLLLTHFHADHAEGIPGVLRGRSVGAIEVTAAEEADGERSRVLRWAGAGGIPVVRAQRGERRTVGAELAWQVLWPTSPLAPEAEGANNSSIAILATVGPSAAPLRVALLGDLEPPAQAAVLALGLPPPAPPAPPPAVQGVPTVPTAPTVRAAPPATTNRTSARGSADGVSVAGSGADGAGRSVLAGSAGSAAPSGPGPPGVGRVDVLKVAHHGSAGQDWSLTAALRPRLALISCGEGNPYGHPAARTVAGLRALGAMVVRTDRSGDIAVLGDARTLAVATHPRPARG